LLRITFAPEANPMSSLSFHYTLEHLAEHLARLTSKASNLYILTDSNVQESVLPDLLPLIHPDKQVEIFEVEPGEESKSIEIASQVWSGLLESNADRHSVILNIGGGVVTDLGGFIASVYKRGIPFIHIPTSVMAMCDAAIGGKTGIDFNFYKNAIGSFCEPNAVLIYPHFIRTLPVSELKSGYAEMLKHAIIADFQLFTALESIEIDNADHIALFIERSANIKHDIVSEDFLEKGRRKILNFGHTIGHALESCMLEKGAPLTHGHAVALGMLAESALATQIGCLSQDEYFKIKNIIELHYPKPKGLHFEDVIGFIRNDKKNKNKQILFALPDGLGHAQWDISISEQDIQTVVEDLFTS
jgi:3-dehydroquinate synthase